MIMRESPSRQNDLLIATISLLQDYYACFTRGLRGPTSRPQHAVVGHRSRKIRRRLSFAGNRTVMRSALLKVVGNPG
jgi:hypothetical protein